MNTLISDLAKALIKFLITVYRYSFSLIIGRQCRFAPSCSEYTYEAVERFGAVRGLYLGFRRIGRCRRGQPHGFDPVPETFSWKPDLSHLHDLDDG